MERSHQFLEVDSLFRRYTIFVEPFRNTTSVYCEECDAFVAEFDGDKVTTLSELELYERIIDSHREKTEKFK